MKKLIKQLPLWMAIILVTFISCEQEEHPLSALQGTIRFGGISLEFAPMGSPGSRISGNTSWVHVFPNSANLVFINKATGQEYLLEYDPNDFSTPYVITLPYGAYEYHTIVEGGIFTAFLPFEAKGEISLDSQSLEISLEAATEYGLVTVKDQYVENASLSDGEKETNLMEHQESNYWFLYVKGGTDATLTIVESFQGSTISRELDIAANRHYNFVLKLIENSAAITGLILAPFELEEEEILLGSDSVFFEENGTIKCPGASPGEKGMVGDKIYEAVDRALLIQRRDEGADLSCLCTSLVSDMSWIFLDASSFNQPIGNWDVGNVTNMDAMFREATSFNQPIKNWNVSNVTNMGGMFAYATNFNQPIGSWNVSKVTNMSFMFEIAYGFNQPIGDWDVGNVTNMSTMFIDAISFNQAIGSWNVSKVTDMSYMFEQAKNFNQPIGDWDISNVRDIVGMFSGAQNFNQPIGNWDVSNVTGMYAMFAVAQNFNQPIGNWDVGNVTDMNGMFQGASNFNQPIEDWDVSNVTNMSGMFSFATTFTQPIGNWDVNNVTDMREMFAVAQNFNQPIGNWDVGKVTDMRWMFQGASNFNQPIEDWDVSNVTNMNRMFNMATLFNQNLGSWCVQNIPIVPTDFSTDSALLESNKPVWGTCPE